MRIIHGDRRDPYFNLASEEYLLESADDDVFMIWQNAAAVIIGKNQNAYAEVNIPFAEEHGIRVVRRLTGGGAVFHDPGTVNFTFVTKAPEEPKIDFAMFTAPVTDALSSLGIKAELGGRNDILSDGYKISGNAQCVHRRADGTKMLLHHGTLLYDADVSALTGVLRVDRDKLQSKGIKSVSSRVKNIRDLGGKDMPADDFAKYILSFAEKRFGTDATAFTDEETREISRIAEEKYSTWEWNFGRSPQCERRAFKRFPFGGVEMTFTVDRGIIKEIHINGDFFGVEDPSVMENALAGCRFEAEAVRCALSDDVVPRVISGALAEDIEDMLFGRS